MKLALGTAQFGMSYGIANSIGKVSSKEGRAIISLARQEGIDTIDTAMTYGTSQETLGKIGTQDFKIVTKLPDVSVPNDKIYPEIRSKVMESLGVLCQSRISSLLLHRPGELLLNSGKYIWSALKAVKAEGLVGSIGYSIYSPEELDQLFEVFPPDIVQAPFNIVDRRLKSSGWMEKLHSSGVEVHVRSIFLQGLLLMESSKRPDRFREWNDLWHNWEAWLEENSLTKLEGALQFASSEPMISRMVVGVESASQLQGIIDASEDRGLRYFPQNLSSNCLRLINPANW